MNQALITKHWPNVCNLLDIKCKDNSFVWVWSKVLFTVRLARSKRAIAWVYRKVRGSVSSPYIIYKGKRYAAHSGIEGSGNYILVSRAGVVNA